MKIAGAICLSVFLFINLFGQTRLDGYRITPIRGPQRELVGYRVQLKRNGRALHRDIFLAQIGKRIDLGLYNRTSHCYSDEQGVHAVLFHTKAMLSIRGGECDGEDYIVKDCWVTILYPPECKEISVRVVKDDDDWLSVGDTYELTCDGRKFWLGVDDMRAYETKHYIVLKTFDGIYVILNTE